jgi:D-arabinose 1-dehydrogenase-like Zn-dependent alcohol dehydrogenase
MRAFRYTGPHAAELQEIPRPDPAAGQVLVRVGASGACHSDIGILEAPRVHFRSRSRSAMKSPDTLRRWVPA